MATVSRLRTVSPQSPGWTRRRAGRGFSYLGLDGRRLAADDADRCRRLVIPPAWEEVWICPYPNGHMQATGTDAAGRRQYVYHPDWRRQRDEEKHHRVLEMAVRLPAAREQVSADLALPGMPVERALATAFRLLDLGFFRVGGESYAEENGSHGLATIKKSHVRLHGSRMEFTFMAKSSKEVAVALVDEQARAAVDSMRRRRSGGDELLAWRDGRHWRDITSDDIRAYVKQVVGGDATVKDFRTWHGTVLAAVALAVSTHAAETPTARKRAVARAMREVSEYLGNTPAVTRASYVDPRVVDLFEDGITIERALGELGDGTGSGPATHGPIEQAVLRLLTTSPQAPVRAWRRTALAATG
jgi:DNA topoisomerase IB